MDSDNRATGIAQDNSRLVATCANIFRGGGRDCVSLATQTVKQSSSLCHIEMGGYHQLYVGLGLTLIFGEQHTMSVLRCPQCGVQAALT